MLHEAGPQLTKEPHAPILLFADVIVATIHHLFPKGSRQVKGKVFAVSVRVSVSDFSGSAERESIDGFLHLAVIAETNYVQVYEARTDRPTFWREVETWRLKCDHDSAWREDGVSSSFKKGYRAVVQAAEKEFGKPESKLTVNMLVDNMDILDIADVFPDGVPDVV